MSCSSARNEPSRPVSRRLGDSLRAPARRRHRLRRPDDIGSIHAAITSGARAYLRWDAARPDLVAILVRTLAASAATMTATRTPRMTEVRLTEREQQVLRGMSQGKSNGQIGRELYLSEDTIKTHARRLFRKLEVKDRAQAVAHGFRQGLVS